MIKTLNFINWNKFLEEENERITLMLDFEIDAGFSFTNAIALRKMQKTGSTVSINNLHVPSKLLQFNNLTLSNTLILHSVTIESQNFQKIETTERYTLSAKFSPCSIDYAVIKLELSRSIEKCVNCSEENVIRSYMVDYIKRFADIVKNNILSFINLSTNFTKFVNGSYNLYLIEDDSPYRIVQESEGKETAWHNPLHPHSLIASAIQKRFEMLEKIPDNIKTYLIKGSHYKFLGFYDESFIIYYKIIETIFKGNIFPYILAQKAFGCDDKKLITTLKSSNQKTMMLFIYQWVALNQKIENEVGKKDLINKLLAASQLRNDISHSVDQSEESKKQLPFIIVLSHALIDSITAHHQAINTTKKE